MDFSVAVIGAGVLGLACAKVLAERGLSVVVIERHRKNGQETSSRNSGVIHAGMYYPAGSLKAKLCFRANQMLYQYLEARKVPHRKIGKYIVATSNAETPQLEAIYQKGCDNGVEGLRFANKAELKQQEPYINAVAALYSPHTGIVDVHAFMDALEYDATEAGVTFAYSHTLQQIERVPRGYRLMADCMGASQVILVGGVINAAGLQADVIASLAGIDTDTANYKLHYCKGHYFSVAASKAKLVSHLIYPVPPENMAGLGVHITLDLMGRMRLGPDTLYLQERQLDYTVPENLRTKFYKAAHWYFPALNEDDLAPDMAGIRPKLQGPGEAYRDFVIAEESNRNLPGFINLIGIESPGLTCALAIAHEVAQFLK
jgi:L-2-hydroxyglutarate oxidase LhgO